MLCTIFTTLEINKPHPPNCNTEDGPEDEATNR